MRPKGLCTTIRAKAKSGGGSDESWTDNCPVNDDGRCSDHGRCSSGEEQIRKISVIYFVSNRRNSEENGHCYPKMHNALLSYFIFGRLVFGVAYGKVSRMVFD